MRLYDYITDENLAGLIKDLMHRPRNFVKGALAGKAATEDQDLVTTVALMYTIEGVLYTLAAQTTIDISTTTAGLAATAATAGAIQAAATYCAYLMTVDAAGTVDCLKGTDAATLALALSLLPEPVAATCPFGIWVVANTTNPFIAGTTKDSAAGVSMTFYDLSDIPPGAGEGAIYLDTYDE